MSSKLRPLLLIFLTFLAVLIFSGTSKSQALSADQLNQEGFVFLHNGAATEALSSWQQAEELYREQNNVEGITGTQLNQSLAEQSLGLYPRACRTVTQAIAISSQICQPGYGEDAVLSSLSEVELSEVNRIGVRLLGENLRLLGNLVEAESALTFVQAQTASNSIESSRIALVLGDVHHFATKAAIQSYMRVGFREVQSRNDIIAQINSQLEQAISNYRSVVQTSDSRSATIANLNLIKLFVEVTVNASLPPSTLTPEVSAQLNSNAVEAYRQLSQTGFEQNPEIDRVYGRLNLASNLIAVIKSERARSLFDGNFDNNVNLPAIERLVSDATAIAEKLDNKRALSFAYGTAAELESLKSASPAVVETRYVQALSLAQSIQASDISYDWAYRLAQLNEAAGRNDKAVRYYETALAALTQVREDLVAVNSELRFEFAQKIEPVYRDYIQFLVDASESDFAKAIEVHDSLQLAQIENFLRCGRLVSPAPALDDIVTIHVINLGSFIEVVVSDAKEYYGYSVPASEILQAAENLTVNIQAPTFLTTPEEEFLPYSQHLYDAILRPAEEAGILSSAKRLNFVLDAPFQSIPMGMMHDGSQYLAETHTISNALGLQRSEPTLSGRSRALFAGLIETGPSYDDPRVPDSFGALPETEFEAIAVQETLRSETLLDGAFTAERFADEVATGNYQAIHISTHGQFSSVPEQTFLVAWDELIDVRDMARTFQRAGNIDLLVLSACQTAAGDERSVLGLAGVAVQSGARSAIASLWLVDTTGSSVLMEQFYEGIGKGLNQAEALQQAQVTLLESTTFNHPFYWAPFVLVGG
ncbi:MAG: CHAT domain-containing protein [Cyanobacteria bacterium P01_D01_bin.1]